MKEKDRKILQMLLRDAKDKAEHGGGVGSKDYYKGVAYALEFVLTEV